MNAGLTLWIGLRLNAAIEAGIEDLDASLAAAIKALVERGIGDIEAPNPVQLAIAQFISQRMTNQEPVKAAIPRSIDGKFSER